LVKDAEAKETLVPTAIQLIKDSTQRDSLSKNISAMALHHAAESIANELLSLRKL
jgi:UDP-N-acetylglucosamine--N-acetylmuramyl-(pentapeptide) pyrophosphoryl-undecaprenol N-acetylglucosamine transferase